MSDRLEFQEVDLGERLVEYRAAWELQRQIHREVAAQQRPNTVLLLEHADVYTAGKRTEPHERPIGSAIPVVEVDRGGKLTWHGPGQLVAYPIVRLPERLGVVDYVRRLEEAMIRTFADFGLTTQRIAERSGVWLTGAAGADRKLAQIGIRVSAQTTLHGLSINVSPNLGAFARIIPCGISDAAVTSLAAELPSPPSVRQVADALRPHLTDLLTTAADSSQLAGSMVAR